MRGNLLFLVLLLPLGLFAQKGPLWEEFEAAKTLHDQAEDEAYLNEIICLLNHPQTKSEPGLYQHLLLAAGSASLDFAQNDQALTYYEKALAYRENGLAPSDSLSASILYTMGYVKGKQTKWDEQLSFYQKAFETGVHSHPKADQMLENIGAAYVRKGKALERLGSLQKDEDILEHAIQHFQIANEILEKRRATHGEKDWENLSNEIRNNFAHIIKIATELYVLTEDQDYKALAFEAITNAKASALKESSPPASFSQNLIDLSRLDACMITYFKADRVMYAVVLSSRGSDLKALPLPAYFDSLLINYLTELKQPDLIKDPEAAFGRFCASSHQLYEVLIAPLAAFIPRQKSLIIFPDGNLSSIPFECLIEKLPSNLRKVNYTSLPYLIKRFEIGYAYLPQFIDEDSSSSSTQNHLASLWQGSHDRTTQIMEYFNSNINDNKRKSQALQEAKRRFLASAGAKKAHPFYWAGMISIGDQRPSNESSTTIYWVIGFVTLGFGFSLWKFR